MTELNPCPFCGGEGELYPASCIESGWYVAIIMCNTCFAQICTPDGKDSTKEQAEEACVTAWNTRA